MTTEATPTTAVETPLEASTTETEDSSSEAGEASQEGTQEQQAVKAEPTAEEAKAKAHEQKMASRFATLTKKEREVVARESQLRAENDRIAAFNQAVQQAKQNPMGLLGQLGMTVEEFVDTILTGPAQPTAEQTKLSQVEQQLHQIQQKQEWERQQAEQAHTSRQIEQGKQWIGEFIEKNKDTYELCAIHNDPEVTVENAVDTVFDVMLLHHKQTGAILDINVATKMVEDYYDSKAQRFAKSKRFTPKQSVESESNALKEIKRPVKATPTGKQTLTNKNTAHAASTAKQQRKTLEERNREALSKLKMTDD